MWPSFSLFSSTSNAFHQKALSNPNGCLEFHNNNSNYFDDPHTPKKALSNPNYFDNGCIEFHKNYFDNPNLPLVFPNASRSDHRQEAAEAAREWEEVDMFMEAEFYPVAVAQYANGSALEPPGKLQEKIRKHLAYLRWKIELKNGLNKFRYTSPKRKVYYSLRKICQDLVRNPEAKKKVPPVTMLEEKVPEVAVPNAKISPNSKSVEDKKVQSSKFAVGETEEEWSKKRCLRFAVNPRHDPKAVFEWDGFSEAVQQSAAGRKVALRVKNHLLFHGWDLFDVDKSSAGKKRLELHYRPPPPHDSRAFLSLANACRFLITAGLVKVEENNDAHDMQSQLCIQYQEGDLGFPKSKRRKVGETKSHSRITNISQLIDNNLVAPMAPVYYRSRKGDSKLKEGWVTRDGIKCMCCDKVFTLSKFEDHAGSTNHRPAANIILEDGRSLFELQNELKGKCKEDGIHTKDHRMSRVDGDVCSVCQIEGDLILCHQCASSFHATCIGLEEIPQGDWFCSSCCCAVCSQKCVSGSSIFTCCQCERKHHAGCLDSEANSGEKWSCSKECEKIQACLHELIGKPIVLSLGVNNLTWTLLKSTKSNFNDAKVTEKLSGALGLMHECFEPLKDASTGRDIIEDAIYSRISEDPKHADYQGFYTVVLEKNGVLTSAANVRIYGKKVAEIPLVGTGFEHRGLGMCRILMHELEKQLKEMGVEKLVLPAVPHAIESWTGSFGFLKMTSAERKQLLHHPFLQFKGTIMCQKLLMTD